MGKVWTVCRDSRLRRATRLMAEWLDGLMASLMA